MTLFFDNGAVMPEAGIASRQGKFDREGKGLIAKVAQDLASIFNSMVVCIFASHVYQPQQAAEVLGMVTGIPYTSVEVLKIGERISNLQRAFNNRCGITREDDKLPLRLLEPTNEGAHAGKVPDVEYQLEEYYQVRGWTPDGKPSKEKLSELGLDDVIQDLYIEYPIYA
jgi:aldehyde:ferredoxin oxidoreductase